MNIENPLDARLLPLWRGLESIRCRVSRLCGVADSRVVLLYPGKLFACLRTRKVGSMERPMERRSIRTKDGVRLSFLEGGEGHPVLMLSGWSQTAALYGRQFDDFCRIARVIALDHRGHGESDKPDHGYRVQRLAKDVFELVDALQLDQPDVLAHSMGAAVLWSYLSLFGAERPLRRLILVDEPSALLARPDWSEKEREEAGAIIPGLDALAGFVAKIRDSDQPQTVAEILRPMFTAAIDETELLDIARENLKLPRDHVRRSSRRQRDSGLARRDRTDSPSHPGVRRRGQHPSGCVSALDCRCDFRMPNWTSFPPTKAAIISCILRIRGASMNAWRAF